MDHNHLHNPRSKVRASMSRFSEWLNVKYTAWEKAQSSSRTFLDYSAYLSVDPNVIIDIMMDKALPDEGDLMAIAVKEGVDAYEVLDQAIPEPGVLEVFSQLGPMHTDLRRRMAHAIYEAQQISQEKQITSGTEESKQVYIEAFDRWGFQYKGNLDQ